MAVLEQVRRERVAQGVGAGALGQRGVTDPELEGPLQDRLVQSGDDAARRSPGPDRVAWPGTPTAKPIPGPRSGTCAPERWVARPSRRRWPDRSGAASAS